MAIILNRTALADHMGVSAPTIDRWIKEGMPIVTRGGRGVEWEFSLPDVIRWWGKRKEDAAAGGDHMSDMAEIERRTALAKMQRAELELAKEKGEVAPIREFERAQARMMAAIRTNVMNVTQRAVTQLLGETDEAVFKSKLTAELRLALEQSADADLSEDDEESDD